MLNWKPIDDSTRYRGGSKPTVFCEITYAKLAKTFNVSVRTVRHWVKEKRLDPTNLEDIIDKYNNRYKLDRRRNATHATHELYTASHKERTNAGNHSDKRSNK